MVSLFALYFEIDLTVYLKKNIFLLIIKHCSFSSFIIDNQILKLVCQQQRKSGHNVASKNLHIFSSFWTCLYGKTELSKLSNDLEVWEDLCLLQVQRFLHPLEHHKLWKIENYKERIQMSKIQMRKFLNCVYWMDIF